MWGQTVKEKSIRKKMRQKRDYYNDNVIISILDTINYTVYKDRNPLPFPLQSIFFQDFLTFCAWH